MWRGACTRTPKTARKHADMGFFEGWGVCITQLQALAETLAD
jgi:hypothetical protein